MAKTQQYDGLKETFETKNFCDKFKDSEKKTRKSGKKIVAIYYVQEILRSYKSMSGLNVMV